MYKLILTTVKVPEQVLYTRCKPNDTQEFIN